MQFPCQKTTALSESTSMSMRLYSWAGTADRRDRAHEEQRDDREGAGRVPGAPSAMGGREGPTVITQPVTMPCMATAASSDALTQQHREHHRGEFPERCVHCRREIGARER